MPFSSYSSQNPLQPNTEEWKAGKKEFTQNVQDGRKLNVKPAYCPVFIVLENRSALKAANCIFFYMSTLRTRERTLNHLNLHT